MYDLGNNIVHVHVLVVGIDLAYYIQLYPAVGMNPT